MLGTHHLALFITSGILLNLTPGQDTLYIVGRSISQGRRAGLLGGRDHQTRRGDALRRPGPSPRGDALAMESTEMIGYKGHEEHRGFAS